MHKTFNIIEPNLIRLMMVSLRILAVSSNSVTMDHVDYFDTEEKVLL